MLIGLVGKPNAGKTSFLNAACMTAAKVGNYPFTTIEPNPGTAYVTVKCPCKELGIKDEPKNSMCIDGTRLIPINLLDVAGLVPGAWAQKKITLKAVQFINLGNPGEGGFHLLVDMINKSSNGELEIKIAGGPEAMPGRQQPESVRTGAIDMAFVPASWYKSMVPVNALTHLSLLASSEERKSGLYDFLVKEHEKQGLRYIGNGHVHGPFYFYSKEPIYNVAGLKGKRFRHSPAYPFFPAFGIKPVTAAHSEIYPGLERNVFDGLAINHTNFI
ncbi:MAG: GTPase, partial [Promethearchaeota archaeon]